MTEKKGANPATSVLARLGIHRKVHSSVRLHGQLSPEPSRAVTPANR